MKEERGAVGARHGHGSHFKRGNGWRKLTSWVMALAMAASAIAGFLYAFSPATAFADEGKCTWQYEGHSWSYGGAGQPDISRKDVATGYELYCANPELPCPGGGTYTKIYQIKNNKGVDKTSKLKVYLWFGFAGPGYDPSMWPSDANWSSDQMRHSITHILLSDRFQNSGANATTGMTSENIKWIEEKVLGNLIAGGAPTDHPEESLAHKMMARSGEVPDDDHFRIFACQTDDGHQTVVGYEYNPKVTVTFSKVSLDSEIAVGDGNYSLQDAEFDIYDASTNKVVEHIKTDASGQAKADLDQNKDYYLVETKAPKGFKLTQGHIDFRTGSADGEQEISEDPGKVDFIVRKANSATSTKTEKGEDQPGVSLAGAEFEISYQKGGKTVTQTAISNEDGYVSFHGIPFGHYEIREIKAPAGYKISTDVISGEISADKMTDHLSDLVLDPDEGSLDYVVENLKAFNVQITKFKTDDEDGSGVREPVGNVEFKFYRNNEDGSKGDYVGSIFTDDQGYAATDGSAHTKVKSYKDGADHYADTEKDTLWLGVGERNDAKNDINGAFPYCDYGYTVEENPDTVPEGYHRVGSFTIPASVMTDGITLRYAIDNNRIDTHLQIVKTDIESGETVPLSGFQFQILDSKGAVIKQVDWTPNKHEVDTFTTDESGMVTLPEQLPEGTYKVHEVSTAAPYILGNDVEFTIDFEADGVVEPVVAVKFPNDFATGTVKIVKTDAETGASLTGAEFDVRAVNDLVRPEGTTEAVAGETVGHVVIGADGTGTCKNLPLGSGTADYVLIETKAPDGYYVDDTPIPFTLSWKDPRTSVVTVEVDVANHPNELVFVKVKDGDETALLPGASFALWDMADEMDHPEDVDGNIVNIERQDGIHAIMLEHVPTGAVVKNTTDLGDDSTVIILTPDKENLGTVVHEGESIDDVPAGTYNVFCQKGVMDFTDGGEVTIEAGKMYTFEYDPDTDEISIDESNVAYEPVIPQPVEGRKTTLQAIVDNGIYAVSVDGEDVATIKVEDGDKTVFIGKGELPSGSAIDVLLEDGATVLTTTTDDSGRASLKRLGRSEETITFHAQEIKAPEGYVLDGTIRPITVNGRGYVEGESSFELTVENKAITLKVSKKDITNEAEVPGAKLTITDSEGNVVDEWVSGTEAHYIEGLKPGSYTLTEVLTPKNYDQANPVEFYVLEDGSLQSVVMHDEPIKIEGQLDKRQEIADPTAEGVEPNGDGANRAETSVDEEGRYDYTLDYRSNSNTWADEFTVTDDLLMAKQGLAHLTGITTAQGGVDYDGLMNVWYTTNKTDPDYVDPSGANATLSDGHENPWLTHEENANTLGDDGRAIDYTGWHLWEENIPTSKAYTLSVDDLKLDDDEYITGVRLEYGRVEAGFTTREDLWDRDDLKDVHDDLDDVTGNEGTFEDNDGLEVEYAPTIMHMQVTDDYKPNTRIDNEATLDIYRNGGGMPELESHDTDKVTQVAISVNATIVEQAVNAAQTAMAQTGAAPIVSILAVAAGIIAGTIAYRKIRLRKVG